MSKAEEFLHKIVELHELTKKYLIKCEYIREKTLLQPVKEFRDAYDHLLRTFFKEEDDKDVLVELDAAFSHEYRAFIDTFDCLCMALKEKIYNFAIIISKPNSTSKYEKYDEMVKYVTDACEIITDLRTKRDVLDKLEVIKKYKEVADKMYYYYSEFIPVSSRILSTDIVS